MGAEPMKVASVGDRVTHVSRAIGAVFKFRMCRRDARAFDLGGMRS